MKINKNISAVKPMTPESLSNPYEGGNDSISVYQSDNEEKKMTKHMIYRKKSKNKSRLSQFANHS